MKHKAELKSEKERERDIQCENENERKRQEQTRGREEEEIESRNEREGEKRDGRKKIRSESFIYNKSLNIIFNSRCSGRNDQSNKQRRDMYISSFVIYNHNNESEDRRTKTHHHYTYTPRGHAFPVVV